MKILFYNPAISQSRFTPFEAMRGSPLFRRPNYDALRLAPLCNQHDFVYCDEHIEALSALKPDIVIIHVPLDLARYVETQIKAEWGDNVTTICYGAYPTLFPKECTELCKVVAIGDIVAVWHQILSDYKNHALLPMYEATQATHFDIDQRLELKFGFTPFFSQLRTSYGCHCIGENKDYCYENIMYKNPTQCSLEQSAKAVAHSRRKAIYILDDDFLHDIDYGIRLLEKCWRHKKMWIFQTTKEVFKRPEIFPLLREDGVRVLYLKEDWLGRDLLSNIDNADYWREKEYQVGLVHNNRITVGCRVRLGFEGENNKFYQRLKKALIKLRIDILELAVQTPLPGTATYNDYASRDQIATDLSLYDQWMPVVQIPGVAPQALYTMMEWLRDSFYSWDSIMLRNIIVSPRLGFYNTVFFYLLPNLSYRSNFLEKVGYPP